MGARTSLNCCWCAKPKCMIAIAMAMNAVACVSADTSVSGLEMLAPTDTNEIQRRICVYE